MLARLDRAHGNVQKVGYLLAPGTLTARGRAPRPRSWDRSAACRRRRFAGGARLVQASDHDHGRAPRERGRGRFDRLHLGNAKRLRNLRGFGAVA
jgi:hypothetical protein